MFKKKKQGALKKDEAISSEMWVSLQHPTAYRIPEHRKFNPDKKL
jgi:hypothetical protein